MKKVVCLLIVAVFIAFFSSCKKDIVETSSSTLDLVETEEINSSDETKTSSETDISSETNISSETDTISKKPTTVDKDVSKESTSENGVDNSSDNQVNTQDNYVKSLTKLPAVAKYNDRLDETFKIRRSMLNKTEKRLYDKFLPYVLSYTPFTIDYRDMNYELDTLQTALNAIRYDYPETWLYFAEGTEEVTISGEDYYTHGSKYFTLDGMLGDFNKKAVVDYISKVDRECDLILEKMPEGLSTKEKYIWIADYICMITEYCDDPDGRYIYADGPILDGKGLCQSYAHAYQWLCQKAGLWCMTCSGIAAGEAHAWNVVKLDDGKTYYADLTWADALNNPFDYYFMSYEQCSKTHTLDVGEWIADGE